VRIFFTLFAILAVFLAAYPFFEASKKTEALIGLPWQIEVLSDGSTKVFGLHIGVSHLSDAIQILGDDMELAIVADNHAAAGNLEMYYGHYRVGLLSGKLVILSDASPQAVKHWRENAVREEYMASGNAKKYYLSKDDLAQAYQGTITGLTFIPGVNLDQELVLARFGEPQERIQGDAVWHYLYPEKGLQVSLYAKAKEVLQYVRPQDFQLLSQPLIDK